MLVASAAEGVKVAVFEVVLYVSAPATAVLFPLVSLISVVFTVAVSAEPENVIRMGAVVPTWVAPDGGEEDATENLPDGLVVKGAVLLPAQPVIRMTRILSELTPKLKEFIL